MCLSRVCETEPRQTFVIDGKLVVMSTEVVSRSSQMPNAWAVAKAESMWRSFA